MRSLSCAATVRYAPPPSYFRVATCTNGSQVRADQRKPHTYRHPTEKVLCRQHGLCEGGRRAVDGRDEEHAIGLQGVQSSEFHESQWAMFGLPLRVLRIQRYFAWLLLGQRVQHCLPLPLRAY